MWPQTRGPGPAPGWSMPAGVGGWAPARSGRGTKGPRMAHKGIGNKGPRYNDGWGGACWQAGASGAPSLGHRAVSVGSQSLLGAPSHGGATGADQTIAREPRPSQQEGLRPKREKRTRGSRLPLGPWSGEAGGGSECSVWGRFLHRIPASQPHRPTSQRLQSLPQSRRPCPLPTPWAVGKLTAGHLGSGGPRFFPCQLLPRGGKECSGNQGVVEGMGGTSLRASRGLCTSRPSPTSQPGPGVSTGQ